MKRSSMLVALLLLLALRVWADTATNTATPTASFSFTPSATLTPGPVYSLPFVDHFTSDLGWAGFGHLGQAAAAGGTGTDGDNQCLAVWAPIPNISPYCGSVVFAYSPLVNAASASQLKLRTAGWNLGPVTVSVFNGSAWVDLQNPGTSSCPTGFGTLNPGIPAIPSQGSELVQEGAWSVWEFDLSAYKGAALQVKLGALDLTSPGPAFDWVEVYDPSATSLPVYPTFTISPTFSASPTYTLTASATPSPTFSASPSSTPTGSVTILSTFTTSPTPSLSPTVTRTAICPRRGTVRVCPNPAEDGKAHFYFDLHGPCTAHVVLRNAAAEQVATASAHLSLADPLLTLRLGKLARGLYCYSIELDYDDGGRETVQQGKFYKL